jgi:hypothetical protein
MTSIQRHEPVGSNAKGRGRIRPASRKRGEWGYLIMWEFQVRARMEKRFEKEYGPAGGWVRLFMQDESYIGTELIHNLKNENFENRTYATLDFWTSQEAYDGFREQHLAEYRALDQKGQEMTESEREMGRFVRVTHK